MEMVTEVVKSSGKILVEQTDKAPCLDGFMVFDLGKVIVPVVPVSQQ